MRTLGLLALVLLGGCGFHLRGDIDLPPAWDNLHLQSASPNSELTRALRTGGERAGVNWGERDDSNYIVQVGNERFDQRNLTIGNTARAAELEFELTASLQVESADGSELMPATDISAFRIITNNPNNVTGTAAEGRLIRAEMREELVQQMLRKLRFLAATTPGTTP